MLVLAALAGGALGWVLAVTLGQRHEVAATREMLERERTESDRAIARARRQLEELESRDRDHSELFHALPDLVRQMFAAKTRRGVSPLAVKTAIHVFAPAQVALFLVRPGQPRQLALADGMGLPASLPLNMEVEYGQGRVGYVADARLAMDDADFKMATSLVRRHLEATSLRELACDLVAPIEGEEGLIGVISVGGITRRHGHAKRLLKMLADLAGVAYSYVNKLKVTEHAADIDSLTGTLNKRSFQRRLGEEVHLAERTNQPMSLLLLDIDHFKNYNDTSGHQEGDEVLRRLGGLLRGGVREDDAVARYGGEEFVVLYPAASKARAQRLAEALRAAVENERFAHGARQPMGRVTISGGVATFPEDARDSVGLVRAADQALYEAKAAGRNRIVLAVPKYLT